MELTPEALVVWNGVWASVGHATSHIPDAMRNGSWVTGWLQAVCALVAIPGTWAVAVWSTRRSAQAAWDRDRVANQEAQANEIRRLEKIAADQLFERHCNLATQILFCRLRLKWAGLNLSDQEDYSGLVESLTDIARLSRMADHYLSNIKEFSLRDTRVHQDKFPITAPIDQVIVVLIRMSIDIEHMIGQLRADDAKDDDETAATIRRFGEYVCWCSEDVNDSLGAVVDRMGPRVQRWIDTHRENFEEAFEMDQLPTLDPEVLETRRRARPLPRGMHPLDTRPPEKRQRAPARAAADA